MRDGLLLPSSIYSGDSLVTAFVPGHVQDHPTPTGNLVAATLQAMLGRTNFVLFGRRRHDYIMLLGGMRSEILPKT